MTMSLASLKPRTAALLALYFAVSNAPIAQANDLNKAFELFKNIQQATQNSPKSAPAPAPQPSPAATTPAATPAPATSPAAAAPRPPVASTAPELVKVMALSEPIDKTAYCNSLKGSGGGGFGHVVSLEGGTPQYLCGDGIYRKTERHFSTQPLAQDERRLKEYYWSGYDPMEARKDPRRVEMHLSNPYIPLQRTEVEPGRFIGSVASMGFFLQVKGLQCRADDSLMVEGNLRYYPQDGVQRRNPVEVEGYWRVDPQGAITPHATYSKTSYLHYCDVNECKTASRDTWQRALRFDPQGDRKPKAPLSLPYDIDSGYGYKGLFEDKHGNVWAARHCAVSKFKPDGTEQKVLEPQTACNVHIDKDEHFKALPPEKMVYNRATDEAVLLTEVPLSPDGRKVGVTSAIWRINQEGQLREVLTTHWAGPRPPGRTNILPGKIVGLAGLFTGPQGQIYFEVPHYSGDSKQQVFRIDSGSTKPQLWFDVDRNRRRVEALNERLPEKEQYSFLIDGSMQEAMIFVNSQNSFLNACTDSQGNVFVLAKGIRKYDSKTQRWTTWVK